MADIIVAGIDDPFAAFNESTLEYWPILLVRKSRALGKGQCGYSGAHLQELAAQASAGTPVAHIHGEGALMRS